MSAARDAVRERLARVREECLQNGAMDWRAKWWQRLTLEQRRLLCAMAGADDSDTNCVRRWGQLSQKTRDMVARHAREWARLLEPMKYA